MGYTGIELGKRLFRQGSGKKSAQVEVKICVVSKESSDRRMAWEAMRALALGALLGGALTLCGRWVQDSLVCTALQSAFSAMMLAMLLPGRAQDLSLDMSSLTTYPGAKRSELYGPSRIGGSSGEVALGLAA